MSADAELIEDLGGYGRIVGTNAPPYPCLLVTDTTIPRGGVWVIGSQIQIEALGDLDGTPGKAALRDIAWGAMLAAQRLPERPPAPDQPTVTNVDLGNLTWSPIGGERGQPRYLGTLTLTLHP